MTDSHAAHALTGAPLDRQAATPLHRQIYERVRGAILSGHLPPGAKLPSSRSLASQLATSRSTVELAYSLLGGEGYVVGQAAAGTIVSGSLAHIGTRPVPRRRSPRTPRSAPPAPLTAPRPGTFQLGLPALDAFPRKTWTRLAARVARNLSTARMVYPDAAGFLPLRAAIVAYLAVARGLACSIDQVFVTAGFHDALGLVMQVLLEPGDSVWIEDPGFALTRHALAGTGAKLVPVPVDDDGVDVAEGMIRAAGARFAVITPAHQSPLGVTLAHARRMALLSWASANEAWIIEDDYDSEFRYEGRVPAALKSIDSGERVLYIGSFGKVLFPGLRLGYLVAPPATVDRFQECATLLRPPPSVLDQTTVAEFMAEGHFARHVRRMRSLYAERRAALRQALVDRFGGNWQITAPPGGMHVRIDLDPGEDDTGLAAALAPHGLAVTPLSWYRAERILPPGLLLGFTNVPAASARREVDRLSRALSAIGRRLSAG
jgi:GntR family transcriptional regulator/MocR family aminotransferase